MRAFSWIALGAVAVACGGSAFTTNDGKGGGGTNGAGASAGDAAGSPDVGGSSSAGSSSAGMPGVAGDLGTAGDTSAGGTSAAAGASMGGTDTAGTSTGGTDSAGSSMGGTSMSGSGGTGGTSAGNGGGGTGGAPPLDTVCPKTQPSKGTACKSGLKCSYGNDVRTACRTSAQCSDGVWSITRPSCDSLDSCNNVQVGAACENGDKPCLLSSDQGIYCVCTGCGAGPCTDKPTWACAAGNGGNACPVYAPNLGAACVGDKICGYGSCATANGVNAVCDGSTWSWQSVLCPL